MKDKNFKYIIDEFADVKIIKYLVPGFENLTLKEKEYIYYLSKAALCGRDITYAQNYKHNLTIRKTIEAIIKTYTGERNIKTFEKFLVYAKRVFYSNGIHHRYSSSKFFPEVSQSYFKRLIKNSDHTLLPLTEKQKVDDLINIIIDIIYSEEQKNGDLLATTHMNYYIDVTEAEATEYYENLENNAGNEPISYGLNSRLIKVDKTIVEEFYKEDGLYGPAISKIIYWLDKASNIAPSEAIKEYIKILIEYYKTGDLKLWDEYSIKWALDKDSDIDFINGFIEVYEDPIGRKAQWEALVNIKDEEETKITEIIAENALWFETNSTTDAEFKKTDVTGVSAKVINSVIMGGDMYSSSTIGINLPNPNWIRSKYGSKSVTIANSMRAFDAASEELPKNVRGEFSYDKSNLDKIKPYIIKGDDIHVHLHECVGHGSGKLLPGVSNTALKEFASTLEEARADLFALYFMADEKMIELGIFEDLNPAKYYYELYIKGGLMTGLVRVDLGCDVKEAHMQDRKLIAQWAMELGKKDNVIEKKIKNNKTYFVVNDFLKLREIFGVMLKEVQRIKSTGDYESGKELALKYAVKVDYKLHEEVLNRFKKLKLKPYTGLINPSIEEITKDGKVIDYIIKYNDDFIKQNLEYGDEYSYL